MKHKYLSIFLFLALLTGCTKEFERIGFEKINESQIVHFELIKKQKIEFWTDLEVEYIKPFSLLYEITILKNEDLVYEGICDCLDVDIEKNSTKKENNQNHSVKYEGRLKCNIEKLEPGKYKLIVNPIVKGKNFNLKNFAIILKK